MVHSRRKFEKVRAAYAAWEEGKVAGAQKITYQFVQHYGFYDTRW